MGFDKKKFDKAKFVPRTEVVPVPSLASFFDEGDTAQMEVRGLTGEEMARVNEAQAKNKNMQAVIEALAGGDGKDKIKAIQESLGLSDDIPSDLARRIELLHLGCVDPEMDLQTAAKIFRVAPVDGYSLTNKIQVLSGQGMMPGEQQASGKKAKSKQPSTSDMPEAK